MNKTGVEIINAKNKRKEQVIVENLKDVREILDKHNIQCWLDWGTLLGAIRNGRIIEWDHEVDLGVMKSDFEKVNLISSEIKEKGFFIRKAPISASEITFRRFGYGVDIWLYYPINQNFLATSYYELSKSLIAHILWLLWRVSAPGYGKADLPKKGFKFIITFLIKYFILLFPYRLRKSFSKLVKKILIKNNYKVYKQAVIPRLYFEKFRTIRFYGMTFNVSFNSEAYLEYKYGKNWKTPTRQWDFKEDGAVNFLRKSKEKGEN